LASSLPKECYAAATDGNLIYRQRIEREPETKKLVISKQKPREKNRRNVISSFHVRESEKVKITVLIKNNEKSLSPIVKKPETKNWFLRHVFQFSRSMSEKPNWEKILKIRDPNTRCSWCRWRARCYLCSDKLGFSDIRFVLITHMSDKPRNREFYGFPDSNLPNGWYFYCCFTCRKNQEHRDLIPAPREWDFVLSLKKLFFLQFWPEFGHIWFFRHAFADCCKACPKNQETTEPAFMLAAPSPLLDSFFFLLLPEASLCYKGGIWRVYMIMRNTLLYEGGGSSFWKE